MIRYLAIISSLIFTSNVFANDSASDNTPDIQNFTSNLSASANQKQVIRLLASRGYIVTSELMRDESGRWSGTAFKDGKIVNVAIKLPQQVPVANVTN